MGGWCLPVSLPSVAYGFEHHSWDEVFGEPHPGRKLPLLRKWKQKRWAVYFKIDALRAQKPKPKDIFALVAEEFETTPGTAKRWFDECRAELEQSWAYGESVLRARDKAVQEISKL